MYELLGNIAFYSPLSKKYPEKLLILLIFSRIKYRGIQFFSTPGKPYRAKVSINTNKLLREH